MLILAATLSLALSPFDDPSFGQRYDLENKGDVSGLAGCDVNIRPVWEKGFSGRGVHITFYGDGFNSEHVDFSDRLDYSTSWNFQMDARDVSFARPVSVIKGTGPISTSVAGCDGVGSIGTAYGATFSVIVKPARFSKLTEMKHIFETNMNNSHIRVYFGWSSTFEGEDNQGVFYDMRRVSYLQEKMRSMRTGGPRSRGVVHVYEHAMSSRSLGGFTRSMFENIAEAIGVAPSDSMGAPSVKVFPGCSVLVSATSTGNLDTTSKFADEPRMTVSSGFSRIKQTLSSDSYLSAGTLTGIIADLLEANPELGWRDIQWILLLTASKSDPTSRYWIQNAAGYWYHPCLGFGLVDAGAALELALSWEPLGNAIECTVRRDMHDKIPFARQGVLNVNFTVNTKIQFMEYVYVRFNMTISDPRLLRVILVSPAGTKFTIAYPSAVWTEHWVEYKFITNDVVQILARGFFGEDPNGNWTVKFIDTSLFESNYLTSIELEISGYNKRLVLPEVTKRVHLSSVYPVVNSTLPGSEASISSTHLKCGETVDLEVTFENKTKGCQLPVFLVNKSTGEFASITTLDTNGRRTIDVPCGFGAVKEAWLSVQDRSSKQAVFFPVEIENDAKNGTTEMISPDPYHTYFLGAEAVETVHFKWKKGSEIRETGLMQDLLISLYNYPATQIISSRNDIDCGDIDLQFPSSQAIGDAVVTITPLYIEDDSPCHTQIIPLRIIQNSETVNDAFPLNLNKVCPIPRGIIVGRAAIPTATPKSIVITMQIMMTVCSCCSIIVVAAAAIICALNIKKKKKEKGIFEASSDPLLD